MKISTSKILALGGLCALLAGAGGAAFAQDDHHDHDFGQTQQSDHHYDQGQDSQYRQSSQYRHANQSERQRLDRLHAAYARAASHGNYSAAERAHLHAQAIRARLRAQHQGHDQHWNHDQHRDNDQDGHDTH